MPLDDGTATDPSAARRQPPELLEVGDHIGRYEVVSVLGTGGMGVVYRARDPDLERDVAIKLLRTPAAGSSDPGGPQPELRLLREARAMAKLVHPNLVTVFDVGTYEGRVFVAMEYVEGQTLKQWVSSAEPGWRQRLGAVMAAGRGIAKAHSAGVVHRDLKPDNILVAIDGTALVADFGLARSAGEEEEAVPDRGTRASPRDPLTAQLTSTGALLGTPAYMSPEQFLGKPADSRSDQFSFAVVVYWALWGRRPFEGEYVEDLSSAVLLGRVTSPPGDSEVPRALFPVVERALRPRPEERYESVEAFLTALERAISGSSGKRALLTAGVVAGLALLVAGAFVAVMRDEPDDGGERGSEDSRLAGLSRAEQEAAKWAQEASEWEEQATKALELAGRLAREEAARKIRIDVQTELMELPLGEIPEVLDYDHDGTLVAMRVAGEHGADVKACVRELVEAGTNPPPGVVLELEIDPSGHVTRASTALPGEGSRALATCLGRASRSWQFPRPQSGASVTVTLPMRTPPQ